MGPLIAIDIGNTRIKAGILHHSQLDVHDLPSVEALPPFLRQHRPRAVIAASVSTDETALRQALQAWTPHLTIFSAGVSLPFTIDYHPPHTPGTDRLAAAYWAWKRLHADELGMVILAGTCITYTLIDRHAFIGGAISPGLTMRLRAMHEFTARLPRADIPPTDFPLSSPARSTIENLQLGALGGIIGEVEGFIRQWKPPDRPFHIWISGGDGPYICSHFPHAEYVSHIVIRGLLEYLYDEVLR